MRKSELEKAYLETTYSIFIDDSQFELEIAQAVPVIINQLLKTKKSAAIITAWNPRSKALPTEENKKRNIKLYSRLQENKYVIYNALGQGSNVSWPAEESFFVLGISKEKAERIAAEFEQNAYVYCEADKPPILGFSKLW